uniref:NADH dehydrogenase subunit 6 n=1 Tax=Lepidotrigona flavibasis TaxID=2696055 RepID=A0A6B9N1Y8_9HYME|nr:NADH dehydrogenase subunit 6 [Lepidotrigona flavibasis]
MSCYFTYFAIYSFSFSLTVFIMLYLFNIFSNPMVYLIFVISFTISFSLMIFVYEPSLSIYIYMILMIMVSGMMVIFSYFVCMINFTYEVFSKMKSMFMLLYIYLAFMIYTFYLLNKSLMMKNFTLVNENNLCYVTKTFVYPNYYVLVMVMFFMFLMLFVCSKICISNTKSLRGKKL